MSLTLANASKPTRRDTPFGLPAALIPVWEALGRIDLVRINDRWLGTIKLSCNNTAPLKVFSRSRDGNQEKQKFSEVIIEDLAETMRRGLWIPDSDPLVWTISAHQAQGNHRILAVERSGATISFLVILGVPDEAERQLGRVYGWARHQLMGEDKRQVAISVAGVGMLLGQTVASSYTPDVLLWLTVFRQQVVSVLTMVGKTKDGSSRAGILLACVESLVLDQAINGDTEITELFMEVMSGKKMSGSPWASLHKEYLASNKKNTGGQQAKLRDYHSTVMALKRSINGCEYENDAKGRKPLKESNDCQWHGGSYGGNIYTHLFNFVALRLMELQESFPELLLCTDIFGNERDELARRPAQV